MTEGITGREITIADKSEIDRLYHTYGHGDSAHAFPSLFLWKKDMGLNILMREEAYTVRCAWKGKNRWFFPCGSKAGKRTCIEELMRGGCRGLIYMDEEDAGFLEEHFPGAFHIHEAPEDSEYLYDRNEMIGMPGSRYVKIRNLYHRLEREHRIEVRPIGEEDMETALEIMRQWRRNTARREGVRDDGFMALMTENWSALGMRGAVLKLDGKPWGITAGYALGDGAFDCCLQQAKENISGVSEHLRKALALMVDDGCRVINYEEDLGIEGLRLSKTRMRPAGMKRMFAGERRS